MYTGVDESTVTTDQINQKVHLYWSPNHVLQSGLHSTRNNFKII